MATWTFASDVGDGATDASPPPPAGLHDDGAVPSALARRRCRRFGTIFAARPLFIEASSPPPPTGRPQLGFGGRWTLDGGHSLVRSNSLCRRVTTTTTVATAATAATGTGCRRVQRSVSTDTGLSLGNHAVNILKVGPNILKVDPNIMKVGPNILKVGPDIVNVGPDILNVGPKITMVDLSMIFTVEVLMIDWLVRGVVDVK